MLIPLDDDDDPIEVSVDADGYVCLVDEENEYEVAFSPFNWSVIVEFVRQQQERTAN
jgi:hypothetical protein